MAVRPISHRQEADRRSNARGRAADGARHRRSRRGTRSSPAVPSLQRPHAHCRGLWGRRRTARPAFRRRERDLNNDDPCRLVAAFIRRNFSFSALCPSHSAIGKRCRDITDLPPIRPPEALATPSPQSSAPFSPRQSALNHPLPTPPRDQFPIDGQLLAAIPRVRSSEAFGRRPLGPHPGRLLAPGRHPKP